MPPPVSETDLARLAGAVQLGARWAELLGALALHPDGDPRVAEALARLRAALGATGGAGGDGGLLLRFEDDGASLGGERVEAKYGSKLRWLEERFRSSLLAGVRLRPAVEDAALVRFSRRLVENHGRRPRPGTSFAELWSPQLRRLELRGIELHERRVDGLVVVHAGGRSERARSAPAEGAIPLADLPRAAFEPMELVEGIACLLPPEAAAEPERAVELTRRTLLRMLGEPELRDAGLLELARRVGERFLDREERSP